MIVDNMYSHMESMITGDNRIVWFKNDEMVQVHLHSSYFIVHSDRRSPKITLQKKNKKIKT
jgi:hypothetical protein